MDLDFGRTLIEASANNGSLFFSFLSPLSRSGGSKKEFVNVVGA